MSLSDHMISIFPSVKDKIFQLFIGTFCALWRCIYEICTVFCPNVFQSCCLLVISCHTGCSLSCFILQDYTHEFHKIKSNFYSLREREDLLGSVHRDIEWVPFPLWSIKDFMLLENTAVSEASVTQASRLVSEALVTLLDKTVYCPKGWQMFVSTHLVKLATKKYMVLLWFVVVCKKNSTCSPTLSSKSKLCLLKWLQQ